MRNDMRWTTVRKKDMERPQRTKMRIARMIGTAVALTVVVAAVGVALVVPTWREPLVYLALVGFLVLAAALQR